MGYIRSIVTRREYSQVRRAGEQAMPCAPGSPQKKEFQQVQSSDLRRLIAMEVLREWLEKTAAAIVAVLFEEHLY